MFVKICGVTNEEDALLATALGADAVGFILAPSSRQVVPSTVRDIVKRLPPGVLTVAVVRNEPAERAIQLAREAGVRAVQLHGNEPPATSAAVRAAVGTVFKAFVAGSDALTRAHEHAVDAILVEGPHPGSGEVFDWHRLDGSGLRHRLLLAGGLSPDNVADAVAQVRPWGVDVATGVEASPGKKDPRKLRAFITAARAAAPAPVPDATTGGDAPFDWRDA